MKPIQTAMFVLATMTGVQSAPAADANIVIPDSSTRSEYHTSWVEDSTVSSPRETRLTVSISNPEHNRGRGFGNEPGARAIPAILEEASVSLVLVVMDAAIISPYASGARARMSVVTGII